MPEKQDEVDEGEMRAANSENCEIEKNPVLPQWLSNDLGLGGEKEFVEQSRAKQDQELGDYSMDEGLTDEDIAIFLLGRKHVDQQLLSVEMLKRMLAEGGEPAVRKLLPAVCRALTAKNADPDLITASADVRGHLEESLLVWLTFCAVTGFREEGFGPQCLLIPH